MPYPTQRELKSALLEMIERRGGRVSLSPEMVSSLEGQLADFFGLTEQQRRDLRSTSATKGKALWRSELRGALRTLVREGVLDHSERERLQLTPYGQRRLRGESD